MRCAIACTLILFVGVSGFLKLPNDTATLIKHVSPSFDFKHPEDMAWNCDCYNITGDVCTTECRCYGKDLTIPTDLDEELCLMIIADSNIDVISRNSLQPYRLTLREVSFENLYSLRTIEDGTFRNMPNLQSIYISHSHLLNFLPGFFHGVTAKKFLTLRITHTGLKEIPDLSHLSKQNSDTILHMLDLEGNKIEYVRANSVNVDADQVMLNNNEIIIVDDYAFNGSCIGKLSLRGNRNLKNLPSNAFKGLNNLLQLDLSNTMIEDMPVAGLEQLETLKIEHTPSMKTIPSVYDLPNLKQAFLTHSFHCCAFKYPEQHSPKRHAEHAEKLKALCNGNSPILDTGQSIPSRRRRRVKELGFWSNQYLDFKDGNHYQGDENVDQPSVMHLDVNNGSPIYMTPLRGKTLEVDRPKPLDDKKPPGVFHQSPKEFPSSQITIFCGNITVRSSLIECLPEPNALNPCEDIMGSYYLRVSVWFVVILTMVGNFAVIVVMLFSGGELTVTKFLMCNLSFADFCMGLYLLLIASMDLHSIGTFFNFAFDWQYGVGCQIAGFLTVFASQLSIFTLTLVTVERWFAIAYAIHLTRRIRLGVAAKAMLAGWMYSILIAALPLMGVSNYSSTSICLPMEVNRPVDQAYLISIMLMNGLAFALVVFCYMQIYYSLGYETRRCSTKGEMTIAKKMALLVFTDFICWAPIAFFSLTALAGYPLIGVTRSKILLVFFYPLNSCANPYLYAIMTAQYRKDFFTLLYKCGICKRHVKQYAMTSSLPTTNNTHPVPLLTRTSLNALKENNAEDVLV